MVCEKFSNEANPLKTIPHTILKTVVISLCEHCNLNCWGCDHFSPLAKKTFLKISEFEKDIKQLSELFGNLVGRIKLMGGEPLLHPNKEDFAKLARSYFPCTKIEFTTNAILLMNQDDYFWKTCSENAIEIVATKYPIIIDWEGIINKAKSENVQFYFYGDTEDTLKTNHHFPFDTNGEQDIVDNFMNCFHANHCRELHHGKMYTCTIIPHAKHFNKKFNIHLLEDAKDSIDIHTKATAIEILEFLAKPIPFCRYCNVKHRSFGHKWHKSRKEINEWM